MDAPRRRTGIAALALAGVAACTGGGGDNPDGNPPGSGGPPITDKIALAGSLVPFDACDGLLSYVKEHALDMVGPWGIGGGFGYGGGAMLEEDGARGESGGSDDAEGSAPSAPEQGEDFSGTNVQEEGVDEPDVVKTDGEFLYLVNGEYLEIVDVRSAEPRLLSSTKLDGWSNELLLEGDRLLIASQTDEGIRPMVSDSGMWAGATTLALYDVTDRANPERVSSLQLDGTVLSSRLVDGVARVVLRAEPVGLPFEMPKGSGLRAERDATEKNRQVIEESTVDNWVPYYVHTDANGTESEGSLLGCDQVTRPREFSGLGTATVMSVDLTSDLQPDGDTAVMASGDTIYASAERLYVATNPWFDWEKLDETAIRERNERYTTDIHAFDITGPASATYVGSGNVTGHVLDQWGMSVHNGVLRVATTEGSAWWGMEENRPVSESFVTTFGESSSGLEQLGQVGGLGKDEQIYAVRFIGEIGYVVTFRQTDPLYTVDVSDPARPRVLGELKILGYSAYLHPVGDGLILGVGQDADKAGRTQGLQLSLFDVSDVSSPKRLHQMALPGASTEVEWDHHAFLHWPKTGLTVVPFETYGFDEKTQTESIDNGALAFAVDRSAGIVERGRLTHVPPDVAGSPSSKDWDIAWRAGINRSIVVDDSLVTVSDLGVKVSDLWTLDDEGWLELPQRY